MSSDNRDKFINNHYALESEILTTMPDTQDRLTLTNEYIKNTSVKTNIQIVANTYQNITFKRLTEILTLLNAQVNQKMFRYYKKKKFRDKRIKFLCHHERVHNNTHSNILLDVPPDYDFNKIAKVIMLMSDCFKKLDTKFILYSDLDVKDEFKMTNYATKEYDPFNHDIKVLNENFIVI